MSPFILILRGLALFLQTLFAALPLNISFSPHNTESWCLMCPTPFNPLPGQHVAAHCARGPGAGQGAASAQRSAGWRWREARRRGRAELGCRGGEKYWCLARALAAPASPCGRVAAGAECRVWAGEDLPSTTGYYNTAATRGAGFLLYRDHPEHSTIPTSATRSRHPAASTE